MYCVRVVAGIGVGDGLLRGGIRVSVAGGGMGEAVSVGMAVLVGTDVSVGSEVAGVIDVGVGAMGWNGVAVAVECGSTVTRLRLTLGDVGALRDGAHEAATQTTKMQRTRLNLFINKSS